MSSTGPQDASTSKEVKENPPTSTKTEGKDQEKTPAKSSESGGVSPSFTILDGAGDHRGPKNPPGNENSKTSPTQATVQNLKSNVDTHLINIKKKFLDEDEDSLLKSDDETDRNSIDGSGDAKAPKLGEVGYPTLKIDEKGDIGILKSSTYQANSQDLDSLSSELQDEDMVLKWDDDSDEIVDLNADLETEIHTEKTDTDTVTSTTDLTIKSEQTGVIEKDLLTEIDDEVSATKEKTVEKLVSTDENEEPDKNLDKTIEDMEIDTNETVDSLIANLDQIIDDDISGIDTSNTTVSSKTDPSEDPNANLAQPSDAVIPIKSVEMEVDSSQITEDETVLTKSDNNQTKIVSNTQETTSNKMEGDISSTSKEDILLSEEIDRKSIKISADSTEIDSAKPNINIEKSSGDCDVTMKDAEPKTIETEDLTITSSGNDSMDLSLIEAREHGLNEPNMMIEIPTQEIIDIDSSIDISNTDSGSSEMETNTSTIDNDKLLQQTTKKDILENQDVSDSEKPDSTNANDSLLVRTEAEKLTTIIIKENSETNVTIDKAVTKIEEQNSESSKILPTKKESTNEPSKEISSSTSSSCEGVSPTTKVLPTKELEPVKAVTVSPKEKEHVSKDEDQLPTSIGTPIVEQSTKQVDQTQKGVDKLPKEIKPIIEQKLPSEELEIPSKDMLQLCKEVEQLHKEVEQVPKVDKPTEEIEKAPIVAENSSKEVELPSKELDIQPSTSTMMAKIVEQLSKCNSQNVDTPSKELEIQPSTSNMAETVEQLSKKDDQASKRAEIPSEDVALAPEELENSCKEIELPSKDLESQPSTSLMTEMVEQPSKEEEIHSKEIEAQPTMAEIIEQPLDQAPSEGERPKDMDVQPSTSLADIVDQSSIEVESSSKDIEQPSKEVESTLKDMEPPSKDMEPPSEDVEPSSKEVEPPSKEVEPPAKEVEPSSKEVEPPSKDMEPPSEDVEPSSKEVEPPSKEVEPPAKEVEPSSKEVEPPSKDMEPPSEDVEPSSKEVEPPSKEVEPPAKEVEPPAKEVEPPSKELQPSSKEIEVQPSTSFMTQMAPDTSDEVPDVTDSLGLLAESSRVVEDDEEQETSEHDDGDDDDDFDPDDESSNQMAGEHSEDSSAQHSESDLPKEQNLDGQDMENDVDSTDNGEFNFAITEVTSEVTGEKVVVNTEVNLSDEIDDTSDTNAEDDRMEQAGESMDAVTSTVDTEEKDIHEEEPQKEMDTVKLSDTSDNEEDKARGESILRSILKQEESKEEKLPQSPSKSKKLEISKPKHVVNIVDLGESSSEDDSPTDVQEVKKDEPETDVSKEDVTSVNISGQIDIMSSGENTSNIVTKKGEIVISGVPKPRASNKPARLNTSEVTIKTANLTESTLVIPETKINDKKTENSKPKFSLEVFSLDSDDEDSIPAIDLTPSKPVKSNNKCINILCRSDNSVPYYKADSSAVAFYEASKKKKPMVCEPCAAVVALRAQGLVEGIKNFTPLLNLEMGKLCQELVEISDSDDEDDAEGSDAPKETIGVHGALVIEEKLAGMLNETWIKFNIDARLKEAEDELNSELKRLEDEGKEVDGMLSECQLLTDKLRNDLYGTFEQELRELPPVVIYDTPESVFTCLESAVQIETRQSKRRLASAAEPPPAKRPAIPLGYTPLDSDAAAGQAPSTSQDIKPAVPATTAIDPKIDDDKDVSVVTLSAEAAPPDLPPPGDVKRPPLFVGALVYAMRNAFGSWVKARVIEYTPKDNNFGAPFSMCRIKLENKAMKTINKQLPARCLAYFEPSDVRLTIGTRIIALFKDTQNTPNSKHTSFSSGVVAEIPNPVNNYRYLVFFDDGYAQYVRHGDTRLVCESSPLVWEEVHPFSREFVREYLLAYPERPMVRLHTGQSLKTEWKGKWWVSRVIAVDASLVHVHFEEDDRTEWIYRGSTRLAPLYLELQAAERHRARPLPRNRAQARTNMPYVEYTRSDEQAQKTHSEAQAVQAQQEEIRRQRSVAKKSTASAAPATAASHPSHAPHAPPTAEPVTSRVVYYTPKNAVKPYKMTAHTCSPKCKRSDVLALADLRTYNPLAKPLLSGWERQIVRYKGHKDVMYRAPCGRRLRSMRELHRYLRAIRSDMGVDLFDFGPNTHCLAEFVLNKCLVGKKDLSNGKENVPVPCVNYYDDALPEFCSYNTERTPTAGVPLNLDPDFLCGCDCTDDCEDKSKCACWKMTLEGARTIGLKGKDVGYVYKRLPEPLPSGIYECNSRCKCKSTCLNRVAQHPLQLKLQVFKTLNRGWGIRSLNDVPKGSFLCVYAGNLLTDATANLDGLNEGDEYLAELDYIEVVEQMKEGYEDDIPDADKKLDKKESGNQDSDDEDEEESSSEDEEPSKNEKRDGDFEPGYLAYPITEYSKKLRKRNKEKREKENSAAAKKEGAKEKENTEDDCITISDDEEVREPSRFTAQAGMGANKFISKYRSVRSHFGKDEACYIMDAKVQGNIGRYLNHSCCPNVFVQNVFVDTHDPRFPWVSFFAASHIRAGTELTWNYNYDIGSVPGKILYCYCGAPNCRGRLL